MSNIPNSAIPKAGPVEADAARDEAESPSLARRAAERAAGLVRDNPKAALAAGAAVAAGVATAAVLGAKRRKSANGAAAPKTAAAKAPARKRAPAKKAAKKA